MPWDPGPYLAFAEPRLRPALDLLARVGAQQPALVLDLGCGAGNATAHLATRWPDARVVGVDASPAMLARAAAEHSRIEWVEADLASWEPPGLAGVVFSNAALHWLDDHARLFPRLASWLAPGGWLAVQMPDNHAEPAHQLLFAAARSGPWVTRLEPLLREEPVLAPETYYELLAQSLEAVDVWQTTYLHVLAGPDPVLEWTRGSVVRPLLDALTPAQGEAFLDGYGTALRAAYPPRPDGRTLFPFRRLFVVGRA